MAEIVVRSSNDAINAAILAARSCEYSITGEVRGATEIHPGHRLACPFIEETFWLVKLIIEPPILASRFTVLSGISEDLILLVMQNGKVFRWPGPDSQFQEIFSKSYAAGSSLLELIPGRSRQISKEELQREIDEAEERNERLYEELVRQNHAKGRKAANEGCGRRNDGDGFDLPDVDDLI